jgi:hypothetical protein
MSGRPHPLQRVGLWRRFCYDDACEECGGGTVHPSPLALAPQE